MATPTNAEVRAQVRSIHAYFSGPAGQNNVDALVEYARHQMQYCGVREQDGAGLTMAVIAQLLSSDRNDPKRRTLPGNVSTEQGIKMCIYSAVRNLAKSLIDRNTVSFYGTGEPAEDFDFIASLQDPNVKMPHGFEPEAESEAQLVLRLLEDELEKEVRIHELLRIMFGEVETPEPRLAPRQLAKRMDCPVDEVYVMTRNLKKRAIRIRESIKTQKRT